MQEIDYISVKKAASLLGVSVSSVKRWVDAGTLPAVKTCGGHRRLRMDDVMAMQSSAAVTEPEVSGQEAGLSCVQCHSIPDPAQAHQHLLGCVERGDYEGLAHCLQSLLVSGMGIAMLGDAVIFPLMADIGHRWSAGHWDLAVEHLAVRTIQHVLAGWKMNDGSLYSGQGRVAVGCCPPADHYCLGNFLVKLMLVEQGWRVLNLGPNTPFESLGRVAVQYQASLAWVSCGHIENEETFVSGLNSLHGALRSQGTVLFLGGQALQGSVRRKIRFDWLGDTLTQMQQAVTDRFPPTRPQIHRSAANS